MNEEEILEIEEDVVVGEMPLSDEILELDDTEDEIPSSGETLGLDDAEDDSIYSTDSISTTNNNYRGSRSSFLNTMPNNMLNRNNSDSNMLKNVLNKHRNQDQSKMNASARNASESSAGNEKDGAAEQVKDKAVEAAEKVTKEAVSKIVAAKTGSGALGEAAGKAASKLVGPALEKKKKMMKLQLIGIVASISVFFIIIMIPTIYLASDGDIKTSESASRTNYLYGTGSDADLYAYLIEIGVCDTRDECANSQAASFYKELRRVIKSNSNLTQKQADSFIIKMIFYNRDDNDAYAGSDEIKYIANIISSQGKFNLDNAEIYKNEFIKEDGYFNTYRSDLIGTDKNTLEYKGKIYDEIVQQSKALVKRIEDADIPIRKATSQYLVCSEITVTGDLAGTYDLEEYVAKVVSNENDWVLNGNLENNKAQAVIARTIALYETENCTKTIDNSNGPQKMKSVASQNAIAATEAVTGQVLIDLSNDYINAQYDSFCLASSDEENYYAVQKNVAIPKTWADGKIPQAYLTTTCGSAGAGGHGNGLSLWGARYLTTQGYTYDQILTYFYDNAIIKTLIPVYSGLTEASNGFLKRTSRALRDNEYFYGDNASNEGECAWYAVRRTNEILATVGSNTRVSSGGNGRDFCYSSDYAKFNKVYDVQDLKPGMAISWSGGSGHDYGHVAIIEDVYYDENGKIKSVDLSEGSNSAGSGYNTMYKGNYINNNYIWSLANGSYKNQIRQYNCEGSLDGSTGTGCQKFVNVPIDQIKNRWGSYKFICGIDLLSGDE